MNKFVLVALFSALVTVAFGAVAQIPAAPAGHPGHCYSEHTGAIDKVGDIDLPGKCTKATCKEDGSISLATCGVIGVPPEYKLSETDFSKVYPDCCPQPVLRS